MTAIEIRKAENIELYGRLGYTEMGRRVTDGRSRVYFERVLTASDDRPQSPS